jgi:hypothetical protein
MHSHMPDAHRAQEPSAHSSITSATPASKTRRKDKFNRFAWRDAVFADSKTPANAKVLAFGIAKFVNGETGEAIPSTVTLAEVCGCSQAWVRKTIPVLQATGWLDVEYGSRGRGDKHCNRYRINPEKSTPCALLANREKRTVKEHFSPTKEHPVCQEPLIHKEEASANALAVLSLDGVDVKAPKETTDDAPPCPVNTTDSAPKGARVLSKINGSKTTTTAPLEAVFCKRAVEQTRNARGNASPSMNGHAAHLPETMSRGETQLQPRNEEEITMPKMPRKPEPLAVSFEKLVRFYPKHKLGEDRENTLDALELALEMNSLVDLIHAANNIALAATEGAEVPQLTEFLASKCCVETASAAVN